ncbi:MAG: transporter [Bacillota bacterium]
MQQEAKKLWGVVLGLICFGVASLCPGTVFAGMARDFLDVPDGSLYPAYYFASSQTRSSVDATQINTITNTFRLTGTFGIDGKCSGWNVLVPYETMNLSNNVGTTANNSGMGDPTFIWDINLFGGPSLSVEEFAKFVPQTYASLHVSVVAPLGSYDKNNLLNPGSNCWSVTPLVNYSYTPDEGKSWLELYVKPTFFSDNNNYRSGTLSQDPELGFEFHASNDITKWLWLALDLFYEGGGETAVNGVWQNNSANTLSAGCTANFRPWHDGKFLLQYKDTVSAPQNAAQTRTLTVYISQLFY